MVMRKGKKRNNTLNLGKKSASEKLNLPAPDLRFVEAVKKRTPYIKANIDRMQALVRTPEYRKDYEEFNNLCPDNEDIGESKKAEDLYFKKWGEISEKYNIAFPFPLKYDGSLDVAFLGRETLKYPFSNVRPIVQTIKAGKEKPLRDENGKLIKYDFTPHLFDGKYLMLQIDLTAKKQAIMDSLEETIDHYRKVIKFKEKETRNKGPKTLNIWEIYDMHHKEKLSLPKIAQKLSGINKPSTYNKRVMKMYKAVSRAYKKAKELIDQERSRLK